MTGLKYKNLKWNRNCKRSEASSPGRSLTKPPGDGPFCPHVHLIHRRSEALSLLSLPLSPSLSSALDRSGNQNNKDYFNTNRKTQPCDWRTPPSWMMMSLGVRCVGFTSEGTGFTVEGGGEFSFDVCRGMMAGSHERNRDKRCPTSFVSILVTWPFVTRIVVCGSEDAAGSLSKIVPSVRPK